ncbi:protein YIPF5/7 [Nematocida minor]|uniref:protein YIPF5/7 n=1 Tax=Nematocida minor TaxID=1912983 RepID=UPI00221EE7BF|nr:protein YIPF5/7 [Nematocida minor]KAI5190017.1 protein YIPF5/7 [Nematocida minor]
MINSELRRNIKNALIGYKEGDRPLLDDLGIDFGSIKKDSLRILFVKSKEHKETDDMIGPILFLVLFGAILIVRGRVHFGYLYCLSILSCVFIYGITILMNSNPVSAVGIANTLGYSLIPVLIFALSSNFIPGGKVAKLLVGGVFSVWSTFVSSSEIVGRFKIENRGVLIGYPIFLVYMCFIIIAIA